MYKTVRHGENSLQYTILPQHDDASTGMSLKTSGGLCRGRQTRGKRGGRTTTILVVTLLLVCSIVAGTILVPLLLTTDIMAFRKLQQSNMASQHIIHHHAKAAAHRLDIATTSTPSTTATTTSTTVVTTSNDTLNTITTGTTVEDVFNASKTYMDMNMTETEVTQPQIVEVTTGDAMITEDAVENSTTMPTTTRVVETTKITRMFGEEEEWKVIVGKASRPTTDPYRGWLPPRWPFADPSTYLQWTGYHDSLLLPVLLAILVIVLLIAGILYCVRRRYLKNARRAAIGKMSSDLQSDEPADKASLLPEFNSEEE